ncbi:MAG TPA: alpha-galactosidase [Chloroflexota bacterium]|nr:alpha-galactosidase [Chloroflexota bacterium]
MTKIAFIGAGSFGFTRKLIRDILTFPLLQDSTLALMDVNSERLDFAKRAAERLVRESGASAKVVATMDRRAALEGADAVLCTILAGGVNVWKYDVTIPEKYGVSINVGDTRGPSGIFRALRTIPVMLEICRDIEEVAPKAFLLNYTNPMAMLCRAIQRESSVPTTGLCHSVQGTSAMLARWIGAPADEITYTCAGINHMAWYLEYKWNGEDAYSLIRDAITNRPEVYNEEQVRNEMFLAFDYYVTESSGHASEYNAWFRKRPELIEKYCTHGTGWNPGHPHYILDSYTARETSWRDEVTNWFAQPVDLERGNEYAAAIINALRGGEAFAFNGNVRNTGLVTNLPPEACVEVPVFATKKGFNPVHVGALPAQVAAITNLSAEIEEMAVEAAITGNARLVYQAICHDPLTAAVLSLDEIRSMVNEMLAQNRDYLPQFKRFEA